MKAQCWMPFVILGVALQASVAHGAGLLGGPYTIDPVDVNGGGGRSASDSYALTCSVAQAGGIGPSGGGAYEFSGGFVPALIKLISLTGSTPSDQESLWRSGKNTVRLFFDGDITAPKADELLVQEMLDGGGYGRNLSFAFTFTVQNTDSGNPRVLRIEETESVMSHRKWYALRSTGNWTDVADFVVQYVVQVGDASNDGRVLNEDVGIINSGIPTFDAADDDRRDIDGDGRILNRDVGVANAHIPSMTVPKPNGH